MITDAQIEKGRESKKDKTDTETQTKKETVKKRTEKIGK